MKTVDKDISLHISKWIAGEGSLSSAIEISPFSY